MGEWLDYYTYAHYHPHTGGRPHTVVGNMKASPRFWSPQLENHRDLLVYLPPSYKHSDKRYPVIYMHDGQNLFDAATSFSGEWQVDETMEMLAREGVEAIVVGIPNAGRDRLDEYSPFHDKRIGAGGKGKKYIEFITETIKPHIDKSFRTNPERDATGILGSSMGGLISLYAFFAFPKTFGFTGVMSPSLWFADGEILKFIDKTSYNQGRIYLDAGSREMGGSRIDTRRRANSRRYYARVRRLHRKLYKKGYFPRRQLLYVEQKWAHHTEAAWAYRLPDALRFLIPQTEPTPTS
ncbi:MAG TPA: alpha/beta hydrolase-fold protein [Anaerolineae bacterium]|nr:alpha/beta hydrolase-fold protein [Anaerolineae bacterium]